MNFTKSPYEAMMKKPSHIQPPPPAQGTQGLPLSRMPLLAGRRLCVLLP